MKRQAGFTLIELVVVIVILGILGAIAIPRFIGVQREARIAVLEATQNALRSGTNMVFAIQASEGNFGANDGADIDNDGAADLQTRWGYPRAVGSSGPPATGIAVLFDGLSDRFVFSGGGGGAAVTIEMRLDGIDGCEVQYTSSAAQGQPATTGVVDTDC